MNKAIICLCEGEHDAAFLYRVLRSFDYEKYDKPIKELIYPLDAILKSQIQALIPTVDSDIEENSEQIENKNISIRELRIIVPRILIKENTFILILIAKSISKIKKSFKNIVINYLEPFNTSFSEQEDDNRISECSLLFLLDADESIENQLKYFKTEIKEFVNDIENIEHNNFIKTNIFLEVEKINIPLNIGLHIINEVGKGTVENILLNTMINVLTIND